MGPEIKRAFHAPASGARERDMPSQNEAVRDELRAALAEVCQAMRARIRVVDSAAAEFRLCSHRSRETVEASQKALTRLGRSDARGDPEYESLDQR